MPRKKREIELGDLVKDKITGFEGIVTGYTEWLTGCDRVVVQPREVNQHGIRNTESFDITMVDVIEKNVIKPNKIESRDSEKNKGGPMPTPSQGYERT